MYEKKLKMILFLKLKLLRSCMGDFGVVDFVCFCLVVVFKRNCYRNFNKMYIVLFYLLIKIKSEVCLDY